MLKFLKESDKYKDLIIVNKLVSLPHRQNYQGRSNSTEQRQPPDGKLFDETELYEELGVTQERRRRALRMKDFEVLQEDRLKTQVDLLKTSLKMWIMEERARRSEWLRG